MWKELDNPSHKLGQHVEKCMQYLLVYDTF